MASHPDCIVMDCMRPQNAKPTLRNITEGFLQPNATMSMQSLSERSCASWRGNRVGAHGYGVEKATYAFRAVVCVIDGEECRPADGKLRAHRSTGHIPPIKITLVDRFGQRPAAPYPDHQLLVTIASAKQPREVRLSGQLDVRFDGGEAVLDETTVTGTPGAYGLLLNFSDPQLNNVTLTTELESCLVGEQSVLGNTACQPCEAGSYRVHEPVNTCIECPDHCICNTWGIAPARNYWIPSPCSPMAEECLSDRACEYGTPPGFGSLYSQILCVEDGREQALHEYFEEQDPTCNLSDAAIDLFREVQCREVATYSFLWGSECKVYRDMKV